MTEKNKNREISAAVKAVEKFWNFFIKAEYERALELFAPGAKIYWPCTREVFDDAADFIKVNRDYPGSHKISLDNIIQAENTVITTVLVESVFDKKSDPMFFRAVSIFTLDGGLITGLTEYWAEETEPPEWRVKSGLTRIIGRAE